MNMSKRPAMMANISYYLQPQLLLQLWGRLYFLEQFGIPWLGTAGRFVETHLLITAYHKSLTKLQ
jgi:hypothetical protein